MLSEFLELVMDLLKISRALRHNISWNFFAFSLLRMTIWGLKFFFVDFLRGQYDKIQICWREPNIVSYPDIAPFSSPASLLVVEHASCRSNHLWRKTGRTGEHTESSGLQYVHLVACQLLNWAFTYLRIIFAEIKHKTWHFLWILSTFLVGGESPTLCWGGMEWLGYFFTGRTSGGRSRSHF